MFDAGKGLERDYEMDKANRKRHTSAFVGTELFKNLEKVKQES